VVASLKEKGGAGKMKQQAGPAMMMGPGMIQGLAEEGLSPEEQQEMMRQMQEAMQQLQPQR
jgi:hypothetical protein